MSKQFEESVEESVPLLLNNDQKCEARKEFSILKVRIVYTFVPVFAMSTLTVKDSLLAQYLVRRLGDDAGYLNNTDFESCSNAANMSMFKEANSLESQASDLQTYYGYAQCIPAFITCLFIGSFSDYFGRRFLLLLPVFTLVVKMTIMSLIIRLHLDLRFMYLANAIDGFAGSWFSMLMALYSLTADISTNQNDRTFWIYLVSVTSSIMEAIANIANGYLISYYGCFEASLLLLSMSTVAFVVPLFFLPETHIHRPKRKEYNPLVHMRRIFGFYIFDGSVRKRATYCLAMLLFVIGVANILCIASIDALYQMHQPFCWSSTQIGYYGSIRGAGAYVLGAVFLKILQRFAASETIAMIGLVFQGSSLLFEAFIWKSWQFYLVPVIGSAGTPLTSIVRSMLSMLTGPDKQGALFSSIAVLETLTGLVAVASWNKIYGATVSFMPGFVYLIMAACSFMTLAMFVVYLCVRQKPQPGQHSLIIETPNIQ